MVIDDLLVKSIKSIKEDLFKIKDGWIKCCLKLEKTKKMRFNELMKLRESYFKHIRMIESKMNRDPDPINKEKYLKMYNMEETYIKNYYIYYNNLVYILNMYIDMVKFEEIIN